MPERQHTDETCLVEQAQKGDSAAFGELYEFYFPPVFRFLYAHVDDRHDAEDLAEDVFLRVWEALPGYRLRGVPFGGYLFRVARNALYDYYRSARRRGTESDLHVEQVDHSQIDPAESVPGELERRILRSALADLRQDYRMVVTLRFLAGLTTEETAAAMGRTPGAVRVLQHRALSALRERLPQDHYEK